MSSLPSPPVSHAPPRPTVALVPLRSPGVGKTRLAGALTIEQRAALSGAMLADVLTALSASPVDRVVVAASGPAAAAAASALGVEVLADPTDVATTSPPARRLDAAIAAAAARLGPVTTLLVVAADLPHLTATDIGTIVAADAEVVVAPTFDGGTGGLLRRPPDAISTAYGPGSAHRHLAAGRAAGRATCAVTLPGFTYDVDLATDLARLQRPGGAPLGPRTSAVLDQVVDDAAAG